jgi:vacuolar protein sorting-associated protein 29
MDVDVLLWGGTHRFEAYEMEGKFFVSPGSATGAFSSGGWGEGEEAVPSFVLMDVSAGRIVSHIFLPKGGNVWRIVEMLTVLQVQGDVVVFYVYQLRKDDNGVENVGVEKVSFRKGDNGQ